MTILKMKGKKKTRHVRVSVDTPAVEGLAMLLKEALQQITEEQAGALFDDYLAGKTINLALALRNKLGGRGKYYKTAFTATTLATEPITVLPEPKGTA
jgi:hypothetical protein